MEEKKAVAKVHHLILENRKRITLSGINDVDSFDDDNIVMFTDLGTLIIKGTTLHISKMNVETGDVSIDGLIYSIHYSDESLKRESGTFFSKLFK